MFCLIRSSYLDHCLTLFELGGTGGVGNLIPPGTKNSATPKQTHGMGYFSLTFPKIIKDMLSCTLKFFQLVHYKGF